MSEIKGAPWTRRVHYNGRVHDFRRCAPGVWTFFEPFIIAIIGRVYGEMSGCTVLGEVHPVSAQNKSLISDTAPFVLIFQSQHN